MRLTSALPFKTHMNNRRRRRAAAPPSLLSLSLSVLALSLSLSPLAGSPCASLHPLPACSRSGVPGRRSSDGRQTDADVRGDERGMKENAGFHQMRPSERRRRRGGAHPSVFSCFAEKIQAVFSPPLRPRPPSMSQLWHALLPFIPLSSPPLPSLIHRPC